MKLMIAIVLAIPMNIVLFGVTNPLWNALVHQPLIASAKDVDSATKLTIYLVDGMFAVLLMFGIGSMLVAASVGWVSAKLTGR